MNPAPHTLILVGYKAIGNYLGITERQVTWMVTHNRLPVFRIGRRPCARAETLRAWIIEQEETGLKECEKARKRTY